MGSIGSVMPCREIVVMMLMASPECCGRIPDRCSNQPDYIIIPVGDFQESPAAEAAVIVRRVRDEVGTASILVIPGGEARVVKIWGCAGSVPSRFRRSGLT